MQTLLLTMGRACLLSLTGCQNGNDSLPSGADTADVDVRRDTRDIRDTRDRPETVPQEKRREYPATR